MGRIFSLAGLVVAICIIGFAAAKYLESATSIIAPRGTEAPAGVERPKPENIIGEAQRLASADRERQRQIEDLSNE